MKAYVKGEVVENPPESLRLYMFCDALGFNHLPVAGGLYDQHPALLDDWQIILQERARQEREEAKKQEAQAAAARRGRGGRR